jgi:5-methylcytosine-specific restriction endonuclease McrA
MNQNTLSPPIKKERRKMRSLRKNRSQKDRDYEKKYREKMYFWVAQLKNKHRVKLHGQDGAFSVQQWKDLIEKYEYKCAECGKVKKLTYDHIVPLSRWNEWAKEHKPSYRANDIENIQPLCLSCNSKKGAN